MKAIVMNNDNDGFCRKYLKSDYVVTWHSEDHFELQESVDGEVLKMIGPEGNIVFLFQKDSPVGPRVWPFPEKDYE